VLLLEENRAEKSPYDAANFFLAEITGIAMPILGGRLKGMVS
jgi:hypothetical protein